ncbi:hypothetical protein UlMin_037528 [Ulmus minor]
MTPIIRYLITGELPIDKNEARKLRRRSAHYAYKYEQLYKRGYSVPLLKCITPERGLYVMQEIHEGLCVAIDYYTKWVEAEPLQEITEARTTGFIWRNIICRFGIPHSLVSDNGTQFDSAGLKKLCLDLGIHKHFSSIAHPQSNGQVEAVNKTIKNNLERKLNGAKGAWVDELPRVLWAYRTTCRTSTNETPFSMTYGTEAVVPTEIGEPSFRVEQFDPESNVEGLSLNLDLLEIKRDNAQIRMVANQKAVA